MKPKRRLRKAKITYISLCPKGKNGFDVLYKEANDGSFDVTMQVSLAKAPEEEQGIIYGVVWAPELPCAEGDISEKEVIKEFAHDFLRDGGKLDIRHDQIALSPDDAALVESFIIQKGDPRFADVTYLGKPVDATGGWGVGIQLDNEKLREEYRSGRWTGLSMFGTATVEHLSKERAQKVMVEHLTDSQGEIDVDKKELVEILNDSHKDLVKSFTESMSEVLSKALTVPSKKDDETGDKKVEKSDEPVVTVNKPVLKDPTDPEQVRQYRDDLKAYELSKSVDWDDPKEVDNYLKTISKSDDSDDKKDDESDEIAALRKEKEIAEQRLQKALGRSTTGAKSEKTITKEDEDEAELVDVMKEMGRQMGCIIPEKKS